MKNINVLMFVLGLVLVGALVVGIGFMVKKYEKESLQQQPAPRPPVIAVSNPEPGSPEAPDMSADTDNQFPTEKGKFLQ
jgi:hypothetical protein